MKRFPKSLLLLVPSILILLLAELVLHSSEGSWSAGGDMAPAFVLERQGGLLEIQRRITEEAGTGAGGMLASERMYKWDRGLFWRLHENLDLEARNYLAPQEWGESPPFTIQTNSRGLRMEGEPGERGAPRIVCIGNSCTFGWGVERDGTYSAHLKKLLDGKLGMKEVEVWNAGVPGYTSHQGVRFLHENLADWKPDILVISFGFNDSRMAAVDDADLQGRRDSPIGRIGSYASRLHLYRFLESLLRRRKLPDSNERVGPRVSVDQYEENLTAMIGLARDLDIEPVLLALVMPEPYRQAIGRVAANHDVPLVTPIPSVLTVGEALVRGEIPPGYEEIDLPANLAGGDPRGVVFADPIHPNSLGNYMIAMEITHGLLKEGLLKGEVR